MPTRRKPTPSRTSSGFSTSPAESEETVIITEEPKAEEVIVTPEPEPQVVVEAPQEILPPERPSAPPVFVDFAPKEAVKRPKVIKHPRNQPRFSPHK